VIAVLGTWWRRARLEALLAFRDRRTMTFTVILPLVLLATLGSLIPNGTHLGPHVTFAQYMTAGMIASGLIYGGFQGLATAIPDERTNGTLKRLYGSPMPRSAYFAGKVGGIVIVYVLQLVLMLGVGVLAFHVTLPTNPGHLVAFLWLSALALVAFSSLGIAVSSLAKTGQAAAALVAPATLFLQFTSGVFFVYTTEPKWMQDFASVFPLRWLAQGMRSVFLPPAFGHRELGGSFDLPMAALMLTIWSIIGVALCLRTFRWLPHGED